MLSVEVYINLIPRTYEPTESNHTYMKNIPRFMKEILVKFFYFAILFRSSEVIFYVHVQPLELYEKSSAIKHIAEKLSKGPHELFLRMWINILFRDNISVLCIPLQSL